jgi:hypothetical protein
MAFNIILDLKLNDLWITFLIVFPFIYGLGILSQRSTEDSYFNKVLNHGVSNFKEANDLE